MKKPLVAFLLSFFIPGAGLAYLGNWKGAFINIGIALLIGIGCAILLPDDFFAHYGRYIGFGIAGGSGAFARQKAIEFNQTAGTGAATGQV
ncbi:hypothetical protein [Verrucomicrobium sp. BvORR106]|uniref:hypothetical protein n=1 Tax=Verrucomicrobium sp. BvORR106 TaxID=1403819 RepID=UPI0005713749|nr:hypothetical protein [Verrucomicrobium sp. BvORR106]